jgi:hypothetical protein
MGGRDAVEWEDMRAWRAATCAGLGGFGEGGKGVEGWLFLL